MNRKKNILIGAITLSLVISTGVVALAATGTDDVQQKKSGPAIMAGMTEAQRDAVRQTRAASMEEAVADLVENGSITQETADKLTEMKDMKTEDKSGIGTLTEEQRTALRDAEAVEMKSRIAVLVDEGTITQAQADQLVQEQGHKMMQGLNLTDAQREALMQEKMAAVKAAAASLVEKGTLTQDEANAITAKPAGILTDDQKAALADAVKAKLESKLSDLVDEGTITQDQADQLLSDPGALHMGPGGPNGRGGPDGRGGHGHCSPSEGTLSD